VPVSRSALPPPWLRNLPNALSAARLLAGPVLIALALTQRERTFTVLLIAALVTDVLDGWLARRFGLQSAIGAMLDSAADVVTLVCAAFGIAAFHHDVWQEHGVAIGTVLFAWGLECMLAWLRYGRLSSFHTYASKAAGYALGFFIIALFAFGFQPWLFYSAVALSIASTCEELLLLWYLPQWQADVRGLCWVLRRRN
jgi:cardiolipin synthase